MARRIDRAARRVAVGAAAFIIAGCASGPDGPVSGVSPLIEAQTAAVSPARRLIIAAPGVLNSVDMYAPFVAKTPPDTTVFLYRYPGVDGLLLDHRVTVEGATRRIGAIIDAHPNAEVGLLGFSAGGQLVLEAARRLMVQRPALTLRIVLISTASGFPQTIKTVLGGAIDAAGLALGSGADAAGPALTSSSIAGETVWRRYYPTLLYGRRGARDPERQADIARIYKAQEEKIIPPSLRLLSAQAGDLTWRRLKADSGFSRARILLLHGQDDPSIPVQAARRLHDQLPASRLLEAPGHGHLLYLTAEATFPLAIAFLSGRAPPPEAPFVETGAD